MTTSHKKILIVSPYFFPNVEWGGPVTISWALTRMLHSSGEHVEVLTTDVSNGERKIGAQSRTIEGVRIIYARSFLPKLAWKYRVYISIDQIIKGWRLIPKFDVVHFQDVFIFQNFVLSLACKIHKIPYVISPLGNLSFAEERSKSLYKRLFYFLFGEFYFRNCSKIEANSESERKQILADFPDLSKKVIFIPHLIYSEKFNAIDIRSKYKIPKDDVIILFLGRIYDLKGVKELLLGYLEYLKRNRKKAKLILSGPDAGGLAEVKEILKKSGRMKHKVILTGSVTGDLKNSLIAKSDIVALLSKSETIPTVLIEAAQFGKAILCSKECNLQDLVKQKGAIIVSRKPFDISASIDKLASSRALRKKIGEKAKRWFELNYDPEKLIKVYNKVYEETIADR